MILKILCHIDKQKSEIRINCNANDFYTCILSFKNPIVFSDLLTSKLKDSLLALKSKQLESQIKNEVEEP